MNVGNEDREHRQRQGEKGKTGKGTGIWVKTRKGKLNTKGKGWNGEGKTAMQKKKISGEQKKK